MSRGLGTAATSPRDGASRLTSLPYGSLAYGDLCLATAPVRVVSAPGGGTRFGLPFRLQPNINERLWVCRFSPVLNHSNRPRRDVHRGVTTNPGAAQVARRPQECAPEAKRSMMP